MRFLNSFAALIKKHSDLNTIFFETQRGDEHLKLILRKHFVTNGPWIFIVNFLALIPIFSYRFAQEIFSFMAFENLPELFTPKEWIVVGLVYYLMIIYYGILKFLAWYFNVLIVTDHRIIDINFHPPFHRQTTQAQLEEIQDIYHQQGGIFAIIFNYGNLFIQTAATRQNISLKQVPKPNKAHKLIAQLLP